MSRPKVTGRCPACGSDGTLFVASGDYITCSLDKCPNPSLVSDWLGREDGVWVKRDHFEETEAARAKLAKTVDDLLEALDIIGTIPDERGLIGERAMARIVARAARSELA